MRESGVLRIEVYRSELEPTLTELLAPRPGALEEWRWRRSGPSSGSLDGHAVLAWKAERPMEVLSALPVRILQDGRLEKGAELSRAFGAGGSLTRQERVALLHHLLASLEAQGVRFVFATPSLELSEELLAEGGFFQAFDLVGRQLPLSMGTRDPDDAPGTVRRVAKLARRLRQKLIEVDPNDGWLNFAQRLFFQRTPDLDFALDRSAAQLGWRYRDHPRRRYRFSVLRRKAGTGLDAFVVWRIVESGPGRRALQLVDHWTRIGERRSTAWLLGEMALLGFAEEGVDAVEAHAPVGSALEQTLIASGCILKREQLPVFMKLLGADAAEGAWIFGRPLQLRAGDFERF